MTFEEMRKELEKQCESHGDQCRNCVLREPLSNSLCVGLHQGFYFDDAEIKYQYDLLTELTSGAKESVTDNPVSHPSHYTQGGIECIDAMIAAFGEQAVAHFCMCNAFKYLWRHNFKNGLEDINKAEWYLNKYKELKYSE
jgi:hypothetical protein